MAADVVFDPLPCSFLHYLCLCVRARGSLFSSLPLDVSSPDGSIISLCGSITSRQLRRGVTPAPRGRGVYQQMWVPHPQAGKQGKEDM